MNHLTRYQTNIMLCVVLMLSVWMSVGCTNPQKKKEKEIHNAEFHYKVASGYYHNRQVPLALRELTIGLKKNPKHVESHYLLGFIYVGRRNYPKAVHHFKSAVKYKPTHFDAKNALGATYLAMERWDDAAKIFEELLNQPLYTSPELAHNNLGWALYNQRKYTKAAQHFKMSIFLKPSFCLGYNNMGLATTAMRNYSQATKYYQAAIQKCPTYAEPHFNLGKLLQDADRAQAIVHFKRCIELQPESQIGQRCQQYLQAL